MSKRQALLKRGHKPQISVRLSERLLSRIDAAAEEMAKRSNHPATRTDAIRFLLGIGLQKF